MWKAFLAILLAVCLYGVRNDAAPTIAVPAAKTTHLRAVPAARSTVPLTPVTHSRHSAVLGRTADKRVLHTATKPHNAIRARTGTKPHKVITARTAKNTRHPKKSLPHKISPRTVESSPPEGGAPAAAPGDAPPPEGGAPAAAPGDAPPPEGGAPPPEGGAPPPEGEAPAPEGEAPAPEGGDLPLAPGSPRPPEAETPAPTAGDVPPPEGGAPAPPEGDALSAEGGDLPLAPGSPRPPEAETPAPTAGDAPPPEGEAPASAEGDGPAPEGGDLPLAPGSPRPPEAETPAPTAGDAPAPEGEAPAPAEGDAPAPENALKVTVGICLPGQVLTKNKGCQNNDELIERILLRTWMADDISEVRQRGIPVEKCKRGEILTSLGCVEKKKKRDGTYKSMRSGRRSAVVPQHLDLGLETDSKETNRRTQPEVHGEYISEESKSTEKPKTKRKKPRERVYGHNRRRLFVYLPGRLLQSTRKCRPYEVLGRDKRCIKKKGPTGFYKHKEHVYHQQRRHRHPGKIPPPIE